MENQMESWQKRIERLMAIQREIARTPQGGLWRSPQPPLPGVDEAELRGIEAALGSPLPRELRTFYGLVGGWAPFRGDIDILCPAELIAGPRYERATELARATEEGFVHSGVGRDDLVVFGVSDTEHDLYTVAIKGPHEGHVFWHAGYEIERFADFDTFFDAMIAYEEQRLARMRTGAPG